MSGTDWRVHHRQIIRILSGQEMLTARSVDLITTALGRHPGELFGGAW
ncbi:MAG: hypothetical protein ACRDHO_11850 [Actinomycetota bacterium]